MTVKERLSKPRGSLPELEKYDGSRRRSSALEVQGFPTISEPNEDVDDESLVKRKSVRRIFGYPITIPFIISNEFCERFSYYGMRTVLTIYLTEKLLMDKEEATVWYHEFVALCYATPLLGALLADVFLGKFMTILLLSLVYCVGNAVMAVTSVGQWFTQSEHADGNHTFYQPQLWGPLLGLHLIALGTGGIKPCVSTLGGDQFMKSETDRLQKYFSMFYFSINAGSMVATLLTPELRSSSCMGEDTCFPLAFGIPAIFMFIAVGAFLVASKWYVKVPPMGNPIIDVAKVSWSMCFGEESPESLYGKKKVRETKQLFRVLAIFIPFPFFWALFEQQGSRWVVQANRMDGRVGSIEIKPDQMQVFNPILILTLIPFFEMVVYPLMRRAGLPMGATFRMIAGMVMVALSFTVCGFVELSMEGRLASWNEANPLDQRSLDAGGVFPQLDKSEQVHILAVIPQIFVITCGEIMCSITGLEFAYAYAPSSMKSVCQSFFLLTNAFGNIITIIFSKATDRDLYLYFMWTCIELAAAVLMFFISRSVEESLEKFKTEEIEGVHDKEDAQEGNKMDELHEVEEQKS